MKSVEIAGEVFDVLENGYVQVQNYEFWEFVASVSKLSALGYELILENQYFPSKFGVNLAYFKAPEEFVEEEAPVEEIKPKAVPKQQTEENRKKEEALLAKLGDKVTLPTPKRGRKPAEKNVSEEE